MTLFIRNGWLPGTGAVDLLLEQGRIAALSTGLPPAPECAILEADGMAVVPGLVNGHTHAAMTLLRGYGDDMPLLEWLQTRIWPAEARMTPEDVLWGTRLACLEMIRSGTVAFFDMYWHFHAIAAAVEEMGLRAALGTVIIDVAGPEQGEQFRGVAERTLEEMERYSERIRLVLAPHAIYTVSRPLLEWVAEFSQRHQLPIHIHLSETAEEVGTCLRNHQVRPAHYLDRVGLLTPRTLLAHGVHLDDGELDLIAARGATIVTNPVSNLKLAVGGVFPFARAVQRGIPVGLGTDGASSNNTLDLFQEMKVLSLIQKHADGNPTVLPAAQAWRVATGAGAPLLGQSGRIAVGEPADLLLIRRDRVEMTPEHDFISNLVYAATGSVVDTTIVAGRVLMHQRRIEGEAEIREEVARRAHRLAAG